jgi:hypothetical protein
MTGLLLAISLCGVDRQAIKVASDLLAKKIVLTAENVDISQLIASPVIKTGKTRLAIEHYTYQIKAKIIGYKLEADQDYHIVIQQGKDTMVVEAPAPECSEKSWYKTRINFVRNKLDSLLPSAPKRKYRKLAAPICATFYGIYFVDKVHGQTGVAPNGVELHPLLNVEPSTLCK